MLADFVSAPSGIFGFTLKSEESVRKTESGDGRSSWLSCQI